MHLFLASLSAAGLLLAAGAGAGQIVGTATPAADAPAITPICTDRPTKANYACTVDEGRLQYEADAVNATFLRLDGVTTDTVLLTNPTLKYGLSRDIDVEANLSPLEIVRTRDRGGTSRTLVGLGDLYLRLKWRLVDLDKDVLEVSALPYVKAPTARPGIGDGSVEGGLLLPINYKLTDALTLTTAPEVDAYKDAAGQGRHLNTAQLVNLAVTLPDSVTLYGELWGDWNFDPAGVVRQYSADAAVTYGVTPLLQLDTGVNIGLNRATPGVQAYVGVSQKF